MKKLMYIVIGIIALLIVLVLTGRKSAHDEIIINAKPAAVWNVLSDMSRYPEWNPVMELLEGEVAEGNKVNYRFTQDENSSSEIGATVVKIEPNELLNQKGGIPLILTYNHRYILEPSGDATKVTIHEDYRGLMVNFWNPAQVEKAYARLNQALKERTEEIAGE